MTVSVTNKSTLQKKLFLFDAHALVYRAHFAFIKTPRINSKGVNTSAVYGFINTLLEVIGKQKPSHLAVAFDTKASTFRDDIYENYKANREAMPEDIENGIPTIKSILAALQIPVFEKVGYEADDVIGTLAQQAEKKGFHVYMMTPDKDYGQLVTPSIQLYKPAYMGKAVTVMGEKEICDKWNIKKTSQVIDMIALQGDSSDNIPGVPGIGPKTASLLLQTYETVDNVIKQAHQIKGRTGDLINQHRQQALLSKKLATIATNVPVHFEEDQCVHQSPHQEKLIELFDELEFRALSKRILGNTSKDIISSTTTAEQLNMFQHGTPQTPASNDITQHTINNVIADKSKFMQMLSQAKEYVIDIIIEDKASPHTQVSNIIIACKEDIYHLPLQNTDDDIREVLSLLQPTLSDEKITKIGHNIKKIILLLKSHDIKVAGNLFDTMIAHYLINPEHTHSLDAITHEYINQKITPINLEDTNTLCARALAIQQIAPLLKRKLEQNGHAKLMSDIETPLITVLASMEDEGVSINNDELERIASIFKKESARLQALIYKIAGVTFNVGSPKQVGEILFNKLALTERPKRTKTGQYATGEEVLVKLAKDHVIVQHLLEFREYEKLRSTYVESLPKLRSSKDGRIHTDYRQTVAATGRLSSVNPNLQNIPIRTEKGRKIRNAFVSRDKTYTIMTADYSQIELRIAAIFAHDPIMKEAFFNQQDIHQATASKVFRVSLDEVTTEMRRKAKEVNFGILYGSSSFGLAQNLDITRSEAKDIIDTYFIQFSSIKEYMNNAIDRVREKGYAETLLGRRRYLHDIHSRNATIRAHAERNAINAPIQGSAADIIKIAMIHIHDWLQRKQLHTKMIMQVHDELVFDVYNEEIEDVKHHVVQMMQNAVALEIPMKVEVGIGATWLNAVH